MLDTEAIEEGNLQLVNIATRISKDSVRKMNELRGWLQTERKMSRVSKQEAFEWAIQVAYTYKMQLLSEEDFITHEEPIEHHKEIPVAEPLTEPLQIVSNSYKPQLTPETVAEITKVNGMSLGNSNNAYVPKKTQEKMLRNLNIK